MTTTARLELPEGTGVVSFYAPRKPGFGETQLPLHLHTDTLIVFVRAQRASRRQSFRDISNLNTQVTC